MNYFSLLFDIYVAACPAPDKSKIMLILIFDIDTR